MTAQTKSAQVEEVQAKYAAAQRELQQERERNSELEVCVCVWWVMASGGWGKGQGGWVGLGLFRVKCWAVFGGPVAQPRETGASAQQRARVERAWGICTGADVLLRCGVSNEVS